MHLSLEWLSEEKHCLAHGRVFWDSKITFSPRFFSLPPLFIKGFPQSALIATGTAVGNRCLLIKQAYRAKAAVLRPIQSVERTGEKKKFKEKKWKEEKKRKADETQALTGSPLFNHNTVWLLKLFFGGEFSHFFPLIFDTLLMCWLSLPSCFYSQSAFTQTLTSSSSWKRRGEEWWVKRRRETQNILNATGKTGKRVYTTTFDRFVSTAAKM